MSNGQANYPVTMMARMLGVSTSGYSAWRKREPSERAREDAVLQQQIETIYGNSRASYGAPRIHAELRDQGIHVGRKRVARLMRQAGLSGICRRRNGTTKRNPKACPAPDLVKRDFSAQKPDQLWVANIKTDSIFVFDGGGRCLLSSGGGLGYGHSFENGIGARSVEHDDLAAISQTGDSPLRPGYTIDRLGLW